jgi:hypothetical protein
MVRKRFSSVNAAQLLVTAALFVGQQLIEAAAMNVGRNMRCICLCKSFTATDKGATM